MSNLPSISGQTFLSVMKKIGYEKDRQKGSHIVLRQANYPFRRLVIPDHRELAKGTPRKLIRESGLSVEEFIKLLKE